MAQWSENSPPLWAPNAVISPSGWMNPVTKEIIVAINNLTRKSFIRRTSVYLPFNETAGAIIRDVAHNRDAYVTDISGTISDGSRIIWGQSPNSLSIIQSSQYVIIFDIGLVTDQIYIITWSKIDPTFHNSWAGYVLENGGVFPESYITTGTTSGKDVLKHQIDVSNQLEVFSWSDGTNTASFTFNTPYTLDQWQFRCYGWNFATGTFEFFTDSDLNTPLVPISTTGALPVKTLDFDGDPAGTIGGFPLLANSCDNMAVGLVAMAVDKPSDQTLRSIYNATNSKFGF